VRLCGFSIIGAWQRHQQVTKKDVKYHPDSEVARQETKYIDNFYSWAHRKLLLAVRLEKTLIDGLTKLRGLRANPPCFDRSPSLGPLNSAGFCAQASFRSR
jgi:hypothetical protein